MATMWAETCRQCGVYLLSFDVLCLTVYTCQTLIIVYWKLESCSWKFVLIRTVITIGLWSVPISLTRQQLPITQYSSAFAQSLLLLSRRKYKMCVCFCIFTLAVRQTNLIHSASYYIFIRSQSPSTIFFILSQKRHDFRELFIEHKLYIFIFCTDCVWNMSHFQII
jgi:hypothetical protein